MYDPAASGSTAIDTVVVRWWEEGTIGCGIVWRVEDGGRSESFAPRRTGHY